MDKVKGENNAENTTKDGHIRRGGYMSRTASLDKAPKSQASAHFLYSTVK